MIFIVEWETFHARYFKQHTIYVYEDDSVFTMYTYDGIFTIKSTVEKREDQSENMMFIERYLNSESNIVRVKQVFGEPLEQEMVADELADGMVSDVAVREEDKDIDIEMTDEDYIDELEPVGEEHELRS